LGELLDEEIPSLSHEGQKKFFASRHQWWTRFTDSLTFASKFKPDFHYVVLTDGQSVSVLFERPTTTAAEDAEQVAIAANEPSHAVPSNAAWVRGPSVPDVTTSQRIVGLDPGCKAVFTAAVHNPRALQSLQSADPVRYNHDPVCHSNEASTSVLH